MGNEILFLALVYIGWKVSQIHDLLEARSAAARAEDAAAARPADAAASPRVSTASD